MNKQWFYIYYPWIQVKQKIFSIKYAAILLVMGFIDIMFIGNIRKLCAMTGVSVTPWILPFLISISLYTLIFSALYMYFYSDAPFIQKNTMYHMIRCGRIKWGIMQIESVIFSSLIFNLSAVLVSAAVLFPYVRLETGWGQILHTMSRTGASAVYGIVLPVPYDVIGKYTPLQVMGLTMILLWMAGICLGLMMFAVSLWLGRNTALFLASVWCVLPVILDELAYGWVYFVKHLSPLSWIYVTYIGKFSHRTPMLPSLTYILTADIVLCIFFGAAALIRLKTVDLKWSSEE